MTAIIFLTGTASPSLADLHNHVIPIYARHWKKIASNIDIPLYTIQTIEFNFPNSATRCCEHMFETWIEQDINASWNKLLNAIDKLTMPPNFPLGKLCIYAYFYSIRENTYFVG